MVAILYPRRLYELRDVTQPGIGLPDQGVPQLQSSNSSFVVQTIAAGGGGSFSLGASNLGNTLGDTGVTGTRVVLAGIGNLTLSQATDLNGGTISISAGTAAGAGFSAGVSGGNTSGDTGATGTRLVFAGGQSITLSQATDVNGGTVTISGASTSQSVQSQNRFNLTLDGNTSGVLAQISSGTMTLAGGNGITLSQAGNAVTISGNTFSQSVQPETQTFVGGISASNTLYTSGTVNLVGTGNITVASGTGQRVIISGSQSVQPETQTFVGGISASNTNYTSGTVNIVGSGIVTVQSGTGQRVIVNASQSVQAETQTFVGGIAASDTTYTSGTVRITGVGGGVTVSSNTGQRVDISVAAPVAQTVQTQNMIAATLSGNTSGALALMSSGTMTIAGGNNITVSQAGNAFTISGPNVGGAQTGISGIAASNTTYTSGSVTFTGVGGGITVSSNTGQRIDLSVAAQSVESQSFGMSNIGNTSGTTGIASGGQMRFVLAGGNNITLSQSLNGASGTITISAFNQSAQTGISGVANSQTTYTSGTVSLSELGAITIRSTTGNQYQFSVAAQTAESQSIGMSNLGNTSGTTGIASGAQVRMLFAGGNNITLSQSLNGASGTITISAFNQSVQAETQTFVGGLAASNTTYTSGTITITGVGGGITVSSNTGQRIDLSVAAQTGTQFSAGISGGNTSGDTGTVAGRVVLAGGNNITLSGSTNGVSETITISAGAGGGFSGGVSNVGNTSGDTGITGSRLVLAGGNAITLSQSTNASGGTVTISAPTQTVESQSIGMSNVGNTSGTTGVASGGQVRFVLAGGNNITLSQSLNGASGTVTISAFNQTGTQFSAGISGGNTSGDTGTVAGRVVLAGGNGITLSGSTNGSSETITISAFTQSVESQSIGMSNIGNTSGTTGIASGGQVRFLFAGGNNITLSQSLNGASGTITISAPNLGAGAMSVGVSNLGNTAGSTGVTGTRLVLVGTNNITLSQSTDANGGTVSISGGAGGGFSAGVSTGGNTAGDTGVTGTRMVFVGTNAISLSQATAAAGGTVSIDAPATSSLVGTNGISVSTNGSTISVMQITQTSIAPFGMSPLVTGQQGQGTLHIAPIQLPNIQFDRIALGMQISNASNSSFSFTLSQWVGFYTKNASSISLVASTSISTNFSGSGTVGSYSLYGGPAQQTIPWTTTLTGSDYYIGIVVRTTTGGGAGHSVSQLCLSKFTNSAWSGVIGQGSNATAQAALGLGVYSASTSGIPNSIAFTQIQGSGSMVLRAPAWQLRSGTV